jgi:glycosyltransferase involved in cell wall biosynthesis
MLKGWRKAEELKEVLESLKTKTINVPFSVFICIYYKDDPNFLEEAINSILNQSVVPNEIVAVIDGQITKDLERVVSKYEGLDMFKTIRLTENLGQGKARQIALANCTYSKVAVMDADDICSPNRFEMQLDYFTKHPEVSVVGGQLAEFSGNPMNIIGFRKVPISDVEIKNLLKSRCPINHVTAMYIKEEVEKAGGYIDWPNEEDYFLWVRMYQNGAKFINLRETLVSARVGQEMYSRRGGWKYFLSETELQKYMFQHKIINFWKMTKNILVRFVVQVLLPNGLRGRVYRKYARSTSI